MSLRDLSFVNYVRNPTRDTPINVAAVRVLLAGYLIWKTIWYDWHDLYRIPFPGDGTYAFLIPPWPVVPVVEKYLLVAALAAFAVGYRLRLSSLASVLLLTHVAGMRAVYNDSGGITALFIASYVLILFGLYARSDRLSVDAARRAGGESLDALVSRLKGPVRGVYRADALRWSTLVLALIYFGSGFNKAVHGPAWVAPANLSRNILFQFVGTDATPLAEFLLANPVLVGLLAVGTVVLELGLLVALLVGVGVTPIVLGLYGMHVGVYLSMDILFADAFVFLALFVPWDRLYERVVSDRSLDVVFDERCLFCARSLLPLKLLDVNETVAFYTQSDAPRAYADREDVDFERAMYVFDEAGTAYAGYDAFRELLRQYRVFAPLVAVMGVAPVAAVGRRVYGYVAANRSRHFECAIDPGADTPDRDS